MNKKVALESLEQIEINWENLKEAVKEAFEVPEPEEKYPGAWTFRNNRLFIETDEAYVNMHTREDAIRAVTGSRLLQYLLSLKNYSSPVVMGKLRGILDDHAKMLEE